MDKVVQSEGAHYIGAGEIGNGKQVFAVSKVGQFSIGDDKHDVYLVGRDFRGGGSFEYRLFVVRVICANGQAYVLDLAKARARHTKNVHGKLAEIAYNSPIRAEIAKLSATYQSLVDRKFQNDSLIDEIIDSIYPVKKEVKEGERRNLQNEVASDFIRQSFANNDGGAFPEQENSAFALYQAFTNYSNHQRENFRVTENRVGQTIELMRANDTVFAHPSQDVNQKALNLILAKTESLYKPITSDSALLAGILESR